MAEKTQSAGIANSLTGDTLTEIFEDCGKKVQTMIWSKIKKQVESKFAENLKGKIQIYITSYGYQYEVKDLFNRGWITVDGKEVVNFSTPDSFYLNGSDYHYATPTNCVQNQKKEYKDRDEQLLSEKGEFSKFDLSHCCYAFLNMSIEEGLKHESPIINMLSILDKRLGKRTLLKIDKEELHPLVRYFLNLRIEVDTLSKTIKTSVNSR